MSKEFWGQDLREMRTKKGISQRQLAVGAKVNRGTLRRIEEGTAMCDIETLERLLRYLGYELEAIAVA